MSVVKHRSNGAPLIAALAALAVVFGCSQSDPAVGDCDALLRGDRGERESQVHQQFNSYPLETQYRFYICGSQAAHPPWGLERQLAQGGAEAARFLARELNATDYHPTILDIVVAFAAMRDAGTFDATTDPALMALLERKVAQLNAPQDRSLRQSAEMCMHTIRSGQHSNQ